jgi:hypothetical protein
MRGWETPMVLLPSLPPLLFSKLMLLRTRSFIIFPWKSSSKEEMLRFGAFSAFARCVWKNDIKAFATGDEHKKFEFQELAGMLWSSNPMTMDRKTDQSFSERASHPPDTRCRSDTYVYVRRLPSPSDDGTHGIGDRSRVFSSLLEPSHQARKKLFTIYPYNKRRCRRCPSWL